MKFYKKTKRIIFYSIIVILIAIFLLYILRSFKLKESFDNYADIDSYNINYYVITMGQPIRLENIQKQTERLNTNGKNIVVNKIDAIRGDDLDMEELASTGIIPTEVLTEPVFNGFIRGKDKMIRRKYEVGCYMSHVKSMQAIADSNADYGIIFEDDFEIQPEFFNQLEKAMNFLTKNKVDFDILFLGMNGPGIEIKQIGENVYKQSCEFSGEYVNCFGLHGYLIPRNKVNNIISKLDTIDEIIDEKLLELGEEGVFTIYRLIPDIVKQNSGETGSTIR